MKQKPYILNTISNSDSKLDKNPGPKNQINIEIMINNPKISSTEENMISIGMIAPDGMRWDQYGNPEFIEE